MAWTVAAQQPGQWWKSLADWMFQVAVWWRIFLRLWALSAVRACVTPFSVTDAAQVAIIASLDAADELLERVAGTVEERERVAAAVRGLGWDVPDAQGNFVWLPEGDAVGLAATLGSLAVPVLVRPFAGEGVRITVGAPQENDAMLAALAELRA